MITVIAGESLVNDATALIVYRFALIAALTSTFSFWSASINFFIVALGGILLGYIVGYISTKLFARLYDEKAQVIITLIIPYTAYLLAEQIGVSAVIATVTAGMYFSRFYAQKSTVETRQNGEAIWSMLIFVINGIIFTSIGLELHFVIKQLSGYTTFELFKYILVICCVVIAARLIWIFPSAYLPRYLFPKIRKRDPYPSWKSVVLVGWTGMRGIVSLAAVLAIPEYITDSHPFPYEDLLIFITYCVILVTLLLPTLTLPFLMRILHVKNGDEDMREEALARLRITETVLKELNSLVPVEFHKNSYFIQLNENYMNRTRTLRTNLEDIAYSEISPLDQQKRQVSKNILKIKRQALNELRINGAIHDEVFQRLLRELDLEDLRLKTQRI
jgi:CPA1 family monovalent cation:H+ antiporter